VWVAVSADRVCALVICEQENDARFFACENDGDTNKEDKEEVAEKLHEICMGQLMISRISLSYGMASMISLINSFSPLRLMLRVYHPLSLPFALNEALMLSPNLLNDVGFFQSIPASHFF